MLAGSALHHGMLIKIGEANKDGQKTFNLLVIKIGLD